MRNILGVALLAALLAAGPGSDRDWFLSDQYRMVSHVADIPRDRHGPLVDDAWGEFDKEVGRDLRTGVSYPFWRHCWGWLFVAGLALWGWLRHRRVVRTREEQGLI